MAALTAAALSAEMCFCFSGQISLEGCIDWNPLLKEKKLVKRQIVIII